MLCYMQNGIKVADGIKVTNSADLEIGEILLGYLGGPNVITMVLIKGMQEGQSQRRGDDRNKRLE